MSSNAVLKRCGDAGGRNAWGEPCRRLPALGRTSGLCDLHDPEVERCSGIEKTGERCGRLRVIGTTVCPRHGANARQTREAAKTRLLEANIIALRFLREAIEANDRDLAFRAAAHITRLANAVKIEVSETTSGGPPAWLEWLTFDQRAQLAAWVADAKLRMKRGDPPYNARQLKSGDVIDAEPVKDA